jgi:hypothetical protein
MSPLWEKGFGLVDMILGAKVILGCERCHRPHEQDALITNWNSQNNLQPTYYSDLRYDVAPNYATSGYATSGYATSTTTSYVQYGTPTVTITAQLNTYLSNCDECNKLLAKLQKVKQYFGLED